MANSFIENVDFKDSGITVVGISADGVPAIKAFVAKHDVTVGTRIKAFSFSSKTHKW